MKERGEKIAWLTSYDFPTAQFAQAAGMEMLLVGDSLGMWVYGYNGTVPVTMEQCIVHTEAVRRGAPNCFVVGNMPLGSYQVSDEDAVFNAIRYCLMTSCTHSSATSTCLNWPMPLRFNVPIVALASTPNSILNSIPKSSPKLCIPINSTLHCAAAYSSA